jgi:hypothetical protein
MSCAEGAGNFVLYVTWPPHLCLYPALTARITGAPLLRIAISSALSTRDAGRFSDSSQEGHSPKECALWPEALAVNE